MEIAPVDLADRATVVGLAGLFAAARRVDAPWSHVRTPGQVHGALAYGHDLDAPVCLQGREGEAVVAFGAVHTSSWDNADLAWLQLLVHPDHRRRGHGGRLLGCLEKTAADLGRTTLGTDAWDGSFGMSFAERNGFTARSKAVLRRQHVRAVDPRHVDELHARASGAAAGYELLRLAGPVPESLVAELAEVSASINDAPIDDLDLEDDYFDARRLRAYEEAARLRHRTLYRVVARHRASGRLAGHTTLAVERETPRFAEQEDTTVTPEHRGHRLGLLLKAEMLRWLRGTEPQLETVDTWNMESNRHMVAVNEALGYRWTALEWEYQR